MKLPFLKQSRWPTSKEPEEKVVNPSHDTQLQDHLVEELFRAMEAKDRMAMREALMAIIDSILMEDSQGEM